MRVRWKGVELSGKKVVGLSQLDKHGFKGVKLVIKALSVKCPT